MNVADYTYLANKPGALQDRHVLALEKIMEEFPFFQSARALRLKGLYNQNSFKYNQALKVTAAHTTDRSVLFDFITSGQFIGLQEAFLEEKAARINEIIVNDSEIVAGYEKSDTKVNSAEQSILTSIKEATAAPIDEIEKPIQKNETIQEKLEIGKPLAFSKEEKHSFQEWLQLASFRPIERENKNEIKDINLEKKKKIDLIDKFIENNPKISPVKNTTQAPLLSQEKSEDNTHLMTETLAKVYLEQKKYQKAIQAYEILILKYPEKSSLFADRILDIKFLQENNN